MAALRGHGSPHFLRHASSRKHYFAGTHRIRPPEETWEWIKPLFPGIGITRVADVTWLDTIGVPVCQAVRPASKNLSVSQGKGLTGAGARVSAAMESIETWHAECLDHIPQVSASIRDMAYSNPIRHSDLRWMKGAIPMDALPIRWVEAQSLVSGRSGWLPVDMVELDFRAPTLLEPEMFIRSSNGLASGNDSSEATLHGLCELVERHAWQSATLEPARLRPLSQESITSDPLLEILDLVRSRGFKLAVYDMTCEIPLPVVFVQVVAPDLPVVWHGAGCHTSAEVALSRALTEAAQGRLTYITGARDDLVCLAKGVKPRRAFQHFREPTPVTDFGSLPDLSMGSVSEDVDQVVDILHAHGHEPFYLDLTRPEMGIPVGVTFAPGLKELRG